MSWTFLFLGVLLQLGGGSDGPRVCRSNSSLWELVRLVNMLIVFRFLRIIPDIKVLAAGCCSAGNLFFPEF